MFLEGTRFNRIWKSSSVTFRQIQVRQVSHCTNHAARLREVNFAYEPERHLAEDDVPGLRRRRWMSCTNYGMK